MECPVPERVVPRMNSAQLVEFLRAVVRTQRQQADKQVPELHMNQLFSLRKYLQPYRMQQLLERSGLQRMLVQQPLVQLPLAHPL